MLQLVPCFKVGNEYDRGDPIARTSILMEQTRTRVSTPRIAIVGEGAFPLGCGDIFSRWIFDRLSRDTRATERPCQQRNEKNLTTVDLLFFLRSPESLLRTAASVYSWTALKTSHASASFCRPGLVRVVPRFRGARVTYTFIRNGGISSRVSRVPSLSRAPFPLRPIFTFRDRDRVLLGAKING